jgi:hypothetical protein
LAQIRASDTFDLLVMTESAWSRDEWLQSISLLHQAIQAHARPEAVWRVFGLAVAFHSLQCFATSSIVDSSQYPDLKTGLIRICLCLIHFSSLVMCAARADDLLLVGTSSGLYSLELGDSFKALLVEPKRTIQIEVLAEEGVSLSRFFMLSFELVLFLRWINSPFVIQFQIIALNGGKTNTVRLHTPLSLNAKEESLKINETKVR